MQSQLLSSTSYGLCRGVPSDDTAGGMLAVVISTSMAEFASFWFRRVAPDSWSSSSRLRTWRCLLRFHRQALACSSAVKAPPRLRYTRTRLAWIAHAALGPVDTPPFHLVMSGSIDRQRAYMNMRAASRERERERESDGCSGHVSAIIFRLCVCPQVPQGSRMVLVMPRSAFEE